MNASIARPSLSARNGKDPILARVHVEGTVHSTLARIRMSQEYRNESDTNVEVVYTFPLPLNSTLLDVAITLNGRKYRGQVVERSKAERQYEKAVDEGDTALMVSRPEPGLYVMNLGNLMAHESAVIDMELATLIDWRGNRARLSLPMTLAPRYGEEVSPLAPHEKPVHDAAVERPFSLSLRLPGDLARATISSPTHPVATRVDEGGALVTLQRDSAWMDRDFVLALEATAAPEPAFVVAPGDAETFAYASFQIPSADVAAAARNVKLIIDCSGSMEGASIWLARIGVARLLAQLRPQDRFGIVAFGSNSDSYSPCMLEATEWNLEAAQAWVRGLGADMGGTEMASALNAAFAVTGPPGACDVFLITDGQVADTRDLVAGASRAGNRIFVVGVGVAAQQEVLRQLAQATGGAMENVAPEEDIADAVRRIFTRLVEKPLRNLAVKSKDGFEWEARTPASIFSGDTIHFFAAVRQAPGELVVEWEAADGRGQRLALKPSSESTLALDAIPRVGAALRIQDLARAGEELAATNLAVRHQLVSAQTNYVLVIEREEMRAAKMPAIRQVAHMVAEVDLAGLEQTLSVSRSLRLTRGVERMSIGESIGDLLSIDEESDVPEEPRLGNMPAFPAFLAALGDAAEKGAPLARSLAELEAMGAPKDMLAALRRVMLKCGVPEEQMLSAFWRAMLAMAPTFGLRPALLERIEAEKDQGLLATGPELSWAVFRLFQRTRIVPVAIP